MKYIADLNQLHNFHTFVTLLRLTILKKKKSPSDFSWLVRGVTFDRIKVLYLCAGRLNCDLPVLHREWHLYSFSEAYCISTLLTFLFVLLSLYSYHFKSCICVALYFDRFHICIHVALLLSLWYLYLCYPVFISLWHLYLFALLWKSSSRHALEGQKAHLWHACN